MNAVRLCFQCELEWDDGRKDRLSPVVSIPIYDKSKTSSNTHLSLSPQCHQLCEKYVNVFPDSHALLHLFFFFTEATTTSQLKISCLNQYRGSCIGKTEIYMLCDKVQKGKFYFCCPSTKSTDSGQNLTRREDQTADI